MSDLRTALRIIPTIVTALSCLCSILFIVAVFSAGYQQVGDCIQVNLPFGLGIVPLCRQPVASQPTQIANPQPSNPTQPIINFTDTPQPQPAIPPTAVIVITNTIMPQATAIPSISIQSNLLQNSGFENLNNNGLPSGWTYDQRHKVGLDTSSMSSYDGSKAFCSRQNLTESEAKGWVGYGQDISVQSGQTYAFGGWVYLQNAIAFHAHIEWYTASGQFIDWDQFTQAYGYPPNGETSNGWIYVQGTKTVPENASILRLGLWHGVVNDMVNAPNSFFCADNLELGLLR